jgi:nicotinamidase-related amidase
MMKPALLVIDYQKAFLSGDPQTVQSLEQAKAYINSAIELFRERNLPVVCIQHCSPQDGLQPGKPGFEVPDCIRILPTDFHVQKEHGNSFHQTDLCRILGDLGVDTVFLAGFRAEYCVLSTYRGAQDNGFAAIMVRGSLASPSHENIRFVECISDVVSVSNLKYLLSEGNSALSKNKIFAIGEGQ